MYSFVFQSHLNKTEKLKKIQMLKHSFQKTKQNHTHTHKRTTSFHWPSFFPIVYSLPHFYSQRILLAFSQFCIFFSTKILKCLVLKPVDVFQSLLSLSLVFEECFNHSLFLNSSFLCALLAVCLNLSLLCGFVTLFPSLK